MPLVKKGGVLILCHPAYDEFDPDQHPSYIEFFHRLLPETRDAMKLAHKYEREFAENPSYVHLYRKGNAYHGVHPFYMWYWGENGRQHVGKVIVRRRGEQPRARAAGLGPHRHAHRGHRAGARLHGPQRLHHPAEHGRPSSWRT